MHDWQPTASLEAMKARAELLRTVRAFFDARNVLEVDTPQLAHHGVSDLHIQCIPVAGYGYLQSSPEYHMKRLLAAGSEPIYQICKAFRDGEAGRRHNPEFTMLEWYRPGFSLKDLVDECLALFAKLFCDTPSQTYSFRELFLQVTRLDPLTASDAELVACAQYHGAPPGLSKTAAVDYLMATKVEAALPAEQLSVVTDFPGWAAALAQTHKDEDGALLARRFEIYYRGLELANGYQELTDPDEQRQRFEQDNTLRKKHGLNPMAADPFLLDAMDAGLPACSGVAMGVERLLMAQQSHGRIDDVQTFPWSRA
ncbi:EF-P lysine aminoacylase GenX [Alcanivorax sp. HI0083]|uniref:EF-P lysine aminoacylase EpmA n=1 Tax=unclassified Alcanivorax TaxID=2638842 RepID=UPI0007B7A7A6|nr:MULTISPECIES: EF-P lysine aminoacylase EpmA [unclassified Alcanivorax]KZY37167.1 EF-P lysine aminoacylase GenX [Alcanivorax sp. HI0044]KZZ22360.1 EF-P lysine aminoacylase GenX [Alcanivorax sp. HI0083]